MSLEVALTMPERAIELEFSVSTGQTLALLGPNGAGKSTVLEAVAGLIRPDRGCIRVDERVLTAADAGRTTRFVQPHRRNVALLAQDALLFPHLSALDNVAFGPRSRGADRRSARATAQEWLNRAHAGEYAHRRPAQLSGGQAQRVAIARAFAASPDLVLLDEPMAALDAQVAPALRRTLQEVLAPRTALIVTHDLIDALLLADRVAVMEDGRIIESGPTLDVLTHPRSGFAAQLADLNMAVGRWRGQWVELDDGQHIEGQTSGPALAAGSPAVAVFRPSSVSIFREPPRGSPRNRLRGIVTEVRPHAGAVRVQAGAFSADITPASVADLGLIPGDSVIFSVKATEVSIYGR